jgi:3-dehydroquinate synthase
VETIKISLDKRSYNIYVAQGLHHREDIFLNYIKDRKIAFVTNTTVKPLFLTKIKKSLSQAKSIYEITLKDGEEYKSQESLNKIYEFLLKNKFGRDSLLIGLGGGVIGDITGYAAATYMRGIDFLQVPTTLLSQVDSSVGGKTGINHALGKNMIGAFHQPKAVIIDIDSLNTLPNNQLSAGLAEVIKYGLIRDLDFFNWLEKKITSLMQRDSQSLKEAIVRSCKNKAFVVAEDEFESDKGIRATLNLGHTFGHAIETALGYGKWLHGEAVASGIVMAGYMSMKMGNLPEKDFLRLKNIINSANLPLNPPEIEKSLFLDLMSSDKKNKDGKINLILLKGLGEAFLTQDYPRSLLEETVATKSF